MAAALLEHETIDGAEVKRIVDEAVGQVVRVYADADTVPQFAETPSDERHPDDTEPNGRAEPEAIPVSPSAQSGSGELPPRNL